MRILYFDICAIPIFLIILFICFSRKMTKGHANQLFLSVVLLSLFSTVADLGMEIADNSAPLSETGRVLCCIFSYSYLAIRNTNNAVLLLFLLHLTHTSFLIRKKWVKFVFSLPYACILFLLVQNPFTHNSFTITAEVGYARGPLMLAFYGIALLYGIVGLAYCIYCRRYLPPNQWVALMSVYILAHIAVLIQFFYPVLLVEMFCTALGEMLIMLSIMRPEERMDSEVGMLSWASYQADLRNIVLSREHVQIVVIRILNYREIRHYLGEHKYNAYISAIANGLRSLRWNRPHRIELYFERPNSIYMITDADENGTENVGELLPTDAADQLRGYEDMGICFEPQVCLIRCPDDLHKAEDIISLGHTFMKFDDRRRTAVLAESIVHSKTFAIEAHIEEILDRAVRENHIRMFYQPIYDVRSGSFRSAEALARIVDPVYGFVSPSVFIPAAETLGFIIPIGDAVLEQVFRFLSEHEPDTPDLSCMEINLSVAQCVESSLPEKIRALQQKYCVDPRRVCFEITETTFENISEVAMENVTELIRMGYSFALDDYGIGYSSIQRVNRLPLKLIKIDKSMLDEVSDENGRIILASTIRMMQQIGKQIVAEGAETRDVIDILEGMGCDYIQGYYFSQPLPEEKFLRYLEEHSGKTG